jgi:glycosyltransferase involved in cell wall biosynthesis
MGQQVYEEQIATRAADDLGSEWTVQRAIVRTLRSPLAGTVRLPSRTLNTSNPVWRRLGTYLTYPKNGIVHRMDLRLPPARSAEVLTILDAVPWRFPDEATPPSSSAREARQAAVVVCPSTFSAEEVSHLLGVSDPRVIPLGVDEGFFEARALSDDELTDLGIRRPFVLHAGGSTLRKNLSGLADAWSLIHRGRPDATLALMGSDDERKRSLFASLDGTVFLGRLNDGMARAVMASAAAVVVPSVYEGFGLPALEAMATGVPVIAVNRASLPEVCGGDALLVEPSGSGIADGVLTALAGGTDLEAMTTRASVRAREFTWDRCVRAHVDVWRSM